MGQSPPSISYNDEGIGEILINGPVEFSNGDHGITKEIKYTSAPTKMCNKGDLIVCIRASIEELILLVIEPVLDVELLQ